MVGRESGFDQMPVGLSIEWMKYVSPWSSYQCHVMSGHVVSLSPSLMRVYVCLTSKDLEILTDWLTDLVTWQTWYLPRSSSSASPPIDCLLACSALGKLRVLPCLVAHENKQKSSCLFVRLLYVWTDACYRLNANPLHLLLTLTKYLVPLSLKVSSI